MVRKYVVSLDPNLFESGSIGLQTAERDVHFDTDTEPTVRMVLHVFVSLLPENHKSAVEMCIMSRLTYEEAAQRISIDRGIQTDKKTVWRWAKAGAEQLRKWLIDSPWVGPLTNGKIPVDILSDALSLDLPWEENDG